MPLFTPELEFSDDYPTIEPSLKLDFANARALDPRITFTRASIATYVGRDGLIKTAGVNEPRFDHDPGTGESLGLLIEEQRTNLFPHNNNPTTNASGTATKSTVQIVLPSGETGPALETDADAFAENYRNIAATANTNPGYLTFYAKKKSAGSTGTLTITMEGGGTARSFNSASINSDTWTKISTTHDWSSSNSTGRRYDIYLQGANTSDSDTSFYVAFQQFEEATFPTSYIPTSGATVTREFEYADTENLDFFNFNEGTFVFTSTLKGGTSNFRSIMYYMGELSETLDDDRPTIYQIINSGETTVRNRVEDFVDFEVLFRTNFSTSITFGQEFKTAMSYKKDDFAFYDGNTLSTDTSGTIPGSNHLEKLSIGGYYYDDFDGQSEGTMTGHIRSLMYYPKRLPNTQLQTLTQ